MCSCVCVCACVRVCVRVCVCVCVCETRRFQIQNIQKFLMIFDATSKTFLVFLVFALLLENNSPCAFKARDKVKSGKFSCKKGGRGEGEKEKAVTSKLVGKVARLQDCSLIETIITVWFHKGEKGFNFVK